MSETFVETDDAKNAVLGQEERILDAIGIDWRRGRPHIDCPYPEHGGRSDWRWDSAKAKAFCTCSQGDNVIEVLRKCERLSFDDAKIRVVDILGRADLIRIKGGKGQRTDAASLLSPPADRSEPGLPRAYLAHRLGVALDEVLMPNTTAIGWSSLAYFDPPPNEGGKPILVGEFPACVFETVAADGGKHAHRIYVAPGGNGKAALGRNAGGYDRDPKKSARTDKGASSTAGRSVLCGDPGTAERIVVAEGIETAAAVAYALRPEIDSGRIAVAAAISAGGVIAFQPYPATRRVTIAADRDERTAPLKPHPTRAGEKAARAFGLKHHDRIIVDIALPGPAGASTDWLDVLRSDGVEAVRVGIEGALRFEPTPDEIDERSKRSGRDARLQHVLETYPLPELNNQRLEYRPTSASEIWVHKPIQVGRGENRIERLVPVCSPLGITHKLRMLGDREDYGLRLALEDMDGETRLIDIDRGELASMNGLEARKMLLAAGLRVSDDGEKIAVQLLKETRPTSSITIVKHPGWLTIDGHQVYVAPDGSILGSPDGLQLELAIGARLLPAVARGGTIDGWKEAAAAAMSICGCEHWTLGVLAGFAGILINLCGLDSCGINLSGQTSSGKTTAQKLAASCWSKPDPTAETLFQTAKATVNSIEFMAARSNGSVFVMDELAHLSGKEAARVIYTLAAGTGKKRMTPSAAARESHKWQTFAILSSETSLEAKLKADGEQWTGGQAVRVVDVDVSEVNRFVDDSVFLKIADINQHHGHAGPAFVAGLIEAGTHNNAGEVRAGINEIARRLVGKGPAGGDPDAALVRAAKPLAVLLTAGVMAQEFKLVPGTVDVGAVIQWAWANFTKSSDAVALDPATQAISNMRQWVAERWLTSIHDIHAELRPSRDALGWFDGDAVYLTPDRLCEAAGGALKEQVIARSLAAAGMLFKTKSPKHLAVHWVPKIGGIKVYALSRTHFGHSKESISNDDFAEFKSAVGGRR